MSDVRIPDDLVGLLRERRVIPFLGAGFSGAHNTPGWEALLRNMSEGIQVQAGADPILTYDEIEEACGGDYLQIAEYLYLAAGESIGPIRHAISQSLTSSLPTIESTPHIELVNLGAPYIYTTNFDGLIESTYRDLGLPVDVIAVPRDMALTHAERPEIVKYHGDLRHEDTLVLTESQYFKRLEFESPMDLKLRSDLLGRSVLFAGYSFQDINIRVIWFRLMQMMQGVPPKDRQPSYIVRLRANPVLDALYETVGLKTLVIDPEEVANSPAEKDALLADFMLELALRCMPDGVIPGTDRKPFVSVGLVAHAEEEINRLTQQRSQTRVVTRAGMRRVVRASSGEPAVATTPLLRRLDQLTGRSVPERLKGHVKELLSRLAKEVDLTGSSPSGAAALVAWSVDDLGPSDGATAITSFGILGATPRAALMERVDLDWVRVWQGKLDEWSVKRVLDNVESEVEGHENEMYDDDDLAFAVDVAKRIAGGQLAADELTEGRERAQLLIERAEDVYPVVAGYVPPEGRPSPDTLIKAIEERGAEIQAREESDSQEEG